ncbi:uncharacterized protein A4U43_C09F12700 [Asparagus officinalis]|uniref:Uncharacterized protein n=1 Tax=Asparagus officinalis TaxID=4686 RepID=A0A5P1EA86_ASPOF|nr:uncharacterized protein A4U43_C09F12700 [Asparagus officinalis]
MARGQRSLGRELIEARGVAALNGGRVGGGDGVAKYGGSSGYEAEGEADDEGGGGVGVPRDALAGFLERERERPRENMPEDRRESPVTWRSNSAANQDFEKQMQTFIDGAIKSLSI